MSRRRRSKKTDADSIDRRKFLAGLSAAGGASLAGCGDLMGGNGQNQQDGNLGERVPALDFKYVAGLAPSTQLEAMAPVIQKNWKELGLDITVSPQDAATLIGEQVKGKRPCDIGMWYLNSSGGRLDPFPLLSRNLITRAGATGTLNSNQYASCKFSKAALQSNEARGEERRQQVKEAIEIMAKDKANIPIATFVSFTARSNRVNGQRLGKAGLSQLNPMAYVYSTVEGKDALHAYISRNTIATTAYPRIDIEFVSNYIFGSTLLNYDGDYEKQKNYAKSIKTENGGARYIVELKEGTFHNGDPVTAEDVKFSYVWSEENKGVIPDAQSMPYDGKAADAIKVVDDRTIEFNLAHPFGAFETYKMAKQPIYHKDSFVEAGANENPSGFTPKEIIGCGPYQVSRFTPEQLLVLEPFDGHPVHDPPNQGLTFHGYDNSQAGYQALNAGELDAIHTLSAGTFQRAQNNNEITADAVPGFTSYTIHPQMSYGPCMFDPFLDAIGKAVNRQECNQLALFGKGKPQTTASYIIDTHPFYPEDDSNVYAYTDDPSGDIEAARQALEEAGWGWDGNGRLHYPPDADLTPLWPQGETPSPEDYPCLTEDGEFDQEWTPS